MLGRYEKFVENIRWETWREDLLGRPRCRVRTELKWIIKKHYVRCVMDSAGSV